MCNGFSARHKDRGGTSYTISCLHIMFLDQTNRPTRIVLLLFIYMTCHGKIGPGKTGPPGPILDAKTGPAGPN